MNRAWSESVTARQKVHADWRAIVLSAALSRADAIEVLFSSLFWKQLLFYLHIFFTIGTFNIWLLQHTNKLLDLRVYLQGRLL